jgi:hypothetical protein
MSPTENYGHVLVPARMVMVEPEDRPFLLINHLGSQKYPLCTSLTI